MPPSPSTLHPSFPNAFKSKLYLEIDGWDAHLKVDHDERNPFSLRRLRKARANIERLAGPVERVDVYTTAKGHHVRVWLDLKWLEGAGFSRTVHATTILTLQAELGDDPQRQKFNAARVERGEPGWNVLWNRKVRNGHTVMMETLDEDLTAKARKILVRP